MRSKIGPMWVGPILAGIIVALVGTAIASTPDGEATRFEVADPAVTVVAAGQTDELVANGTEYCEIKPETTEFCPIGKGFSGDMTILLPVAATCQVTIDIMAFGEPGEPGPGNLDEVTYGLGYKFNGEPVLTEAPNSLFLVPNERSEASASRTRQFAVKPGNEYLFAPYIESQGEATGFAYWALTYVCYG